MAEVLITLAIIGVVAAMTIPTLVVSYQKKMTAVRVKKAYAELIQAIKLSEIDNGPMNSWDFGSYNDVEQTRIFMAKYILPYYKNYKECSTGLDYSCGIPISAGGINYLVNNGLGLSFLRDHTNKSIPMIISVNVNKGEAALLGRDSFYFQIRNGKVLPEGWYDGITRDVILGNGYVGAVDTSNPESPPINLIYSCKKAPDKNPPDGASDEYRHACTALLVLDNWEFKDDYPW